MYKPVNTGTCHSRWCPTYLPAFMDNITQLPVTALCANVSWTFLNILNSASDQLLLDYNQWLLPACQLWCGEPGDQLLQLQSAAVSRTVAKFIWLMVILMMTCAVFQLVSICFERGARNAAMIGGPFFLAFMALIVSFISSGEYDTVFYPIVGATNVAALSYFFSSFQYSIGVTYELASATALVFTMFPIWNLFTVNRSPLFYFEFEVDPKSVEELIWLVLTMLIVSLLWIIHSCIYRTVVFKASWIAAFNRQKSEGKTGGKDFVSGLWILSGAQGHPTWRTPTGQSFGLYLTVLSWIVAVKIHSFVAQENYCEEDLILFHILLWAPPIILTLAMLTTQLYMCRKTSCNVQGNIYTSLRDWILADIEFLLKSKTHMEEALISYRLGRDTLEVENSNEVSKYGGKVDDKLLATILWVAEVILMVIACPGILVCKSSQWLGIHITKLKWCQGSSDFKLSEMIRAYQVVCERCSKAIKPNRGEKRTTYERSRMKNLDSLQHLEIDEAIRTMLRKRSKHIQLSLVLDNLGPSCFLYLLAMLKEVLNVETVSELETPTLDVNGEDGSNEGTTSLPDATAEDDSKGMKALESGATSPNTIVEDSDGLKALNSGSTTPNSIVEDSDGLKALNSGNTTPNSIVEDSDGLKALNSGNTTPNSIVEDSNGLKALNSGNTTPNSIVEDSDGLKALNSGNTTPNSIVEDSNGLKALNSGNTTPNSIVEDSDGLKPLNTGNTTPNSSVEDDSLEDIER